MELIGLYLIAAGLLVVAGVAKAARPDDTARAMAALLPGAPPLGVMRWLVRAGALAEAALGAVAIVFPRPATAALVALSYPASSASWPTPAGAAGHSPPAGASAAPTRRPPRSTWSSTSYWPPLRPRWPFGAPRHGTLATQLAHQPWAGFPLLFVSAVGLWLTALALSALAALTAARRLARPLPVRAS